MQLKKIVLHSTIWFLSTFLTQPAYSHSGRTDSSGCHTNRKTGQYHCHSKKSKPTYQRYKSRALRNTAKPPNPKPKQKLKPKPTKSNAINIDSGPNGNGPYNWEDENGIHIVFDINRVPKHLREKIKKRSHAR